MKSVSTGLNAATQAIAIVNEFFESPEFLDGLELVPGCVEGLQMLKERYRLVVVTSRQHTIEEHTRTWITRHFPGDLLEG
jgi:hypothetical protein